MAQILRRRVAARPSRSVAYPALALAMHAYMKLALEDPRSAAATAADETARRHVIQLKGVGSPEANRAAGAWLTSIQAVRMAEPGGDLHAAVATQRRAQSAFVSIMGREIP